MSKDASPLSKLAQREAGPAARYLIVVGAGFVIDISSAWIAHTMFGVDLVMAAALGFLIAASLSYFAHEFWTFRRADSAVSSGRAAKFLVASAAILGTRLLIVWLTAPLADWPAGALVRLLLAFGGSLVVGFVVNRLLVFNARG